MNTSDTQTGLSYYTWPLIVTGMLFSVVCAGIYTVIIASRTPAQLIETSPYEKGLHFEKTLQERERAKHEKLLTQHRVFQNSLGETFFEVRLDTEKLVAADAPLKMTAQFIRPSSKKLDFKVSLNQTGDDSYSARIPEIISGLWHIDVSVARADGQLSTYRYQTLIQSFK